MDRELRSAQDFVAGVQRLSSWEGDGPAPQSLPLTGARALTRILLQQPALADGRRSELYIDIFSTDADRDPGFRALQYEALGLIVTGALALGFTDQPLERFAEGLILTATDLDPRVATLRSDLIRKRPFGPPTPVLPEWAVRVQELLDRACFAGVMKALLAIGRAGAARSSSDATGIVGLSARNVCPGTPFQIFGAGFGAQQPADTAVYLPTRGGNCREVAVDVWTDTAITVTAPATIGAGCVGFVRTGSGGSGAVSQVSGELTRCFGAMGQMWGAAFDKLRGPLTTCPPCLPGRQNRIDTAGRPVINWFRCTPQTVEPGEQPVLSWSVQNAISVSIDVTTSGGPTLSLPIPGPVGTLIWPPVAGTSVSTTTFRLTAANLCGTSVATAAFTLTRRPKLSITRIEVVQGEQLPDNSVRLVANRRTAVRVFVDSGIRDGFNIGYGPGGAGGLDISLYAYDVDTGVATSCGTPWNPAFVARPTANRDVLDDSANFDVPLTACSGSVAFHATVTLPAPTSTDPLQSTSPPISFATAETTVTFIDRPAQEILPFLIIDPLSSTPVPTMADFDGVIDGPIRMHPFYENGIIVHPRLRLTLSPMDSLFSTLGWERLIAGLTTMAFLFPTQQVGGIRVAVAPRDAPPSSRGGMALPRIGATIPSLIIKVGRPVTCTHEIGHTYGLNHVNCGNPPGPLDPSLPFTLANPAIDVVRRQLWPSAVTNESMTYCRNQWPSRQHWDQIFDRMPV